MLAVATGGLLAACTTQAPQAGPQPAAGSGQAPATVTAGGGEVRLHVRTGAEADTLNDVLPKFTQDTGIAVKLESFPTSDYFTKLQTLIAGGTAGDVWWCAYRNTPRFANGKVIMPLEDLIKRDNFDLSQYYEPALAASRYQGALYALPFKIHPGPVVLYYNAQQVQEGGITMPDKQVPTWDEVINMASKLKRETNGHVDRYGLYEAMTAGSSTNTLQAVTMYVRSWGGEVYSEDGKKSLFGDSPAKDAIRFMYDLIQTQKVAAPAQDWTQNLEDLMIAQRVSLLQASSSTKSIPTKTGGKFDVKNVLLPPGPSGKVGTQAITDDIVINAKTQNPQGAWELTKLLCGQDVGVRLGGGTGGVASGTCGARKDVFSDPRIMANPLHPVFLDPVQNAVPLRLPANLREEEVASALDQTLMPIWLGERQPDDAFFSELNTAIQGVMDQPIA
ncbi:MAG: extracellular solute-binding protein [Chloroflexi bacterium]|nr:extracellular solute-binding protein [Chloroflexota bacterium]